MKVTNVILHDVVYNDHVTVLYRHFHGSMSWEWTQSGINEMRMDTMWWGWTQWDADGYNEMQMDIMRCRWTQWDADGYNEMQIDTMRWWWTQWDER